MNRHGKELHRCFVCELVLLAPVLAKIGHMLPLLSAGEL